MRQYFKIQDDPRTSVTNGLVPVENIEDADLISSRFTGSPAENLHQPVFDLDFPCELLPSSTPGHYHLFLNRTISWRNYKRVMRAMVKAGLVERGYYKMTKKQKQGHVRAPHVLKTDSPKTDEDALAAVARLKELEATLGGDLPEDDKAYWEQIRTDRLLGAKDEKEAAYIPLGVKRQVIDYDPYDPY